MEKYKDTIYSRYFILIEGIFKNTKKILNISRDYLMIENFENKASREIIPYQDIMNVINSERNSKDFKINYFSRSLNNTERKETSQQFSTPLRTQVVCEILKQMDLFTKVNQFPVETFKSYIFFEEIDDLNLGLKQDYKMSKSLNPNILDINLNIYRSIIEWVSFDSKRETRIRISDIEKIKIVKMNNTNTIKIETFNKIDIFLVPKKNEELKLIVDKIIDNAKNFLSLDLPIDMSENKEVVRNPILQKGKIFSFETYRILYNSYKRQVKITSDSNFIYENYENKNNNIYRVNKIPINEIINIICYENETEFFEIVLKSSARYLYLTNNQERNIIVTNLINLLSNEENKHENNFLVLSNKPKYGLRVMGFISDEIDVDYEKCLAENLNNSLNDNNLRDKIIEEICLNFCFKSPQSNIEPFISNKRYLSTILDFLSNEVLNIKNLKPEENKDEINRKLYVINIYLIFYKTILSKFINDKLINDLSKLLTSDLNFQTVFYNITTIIKLLIPSSAKFLKKEEIAKRKWILSLHLEYGVKLKSILYSKIYDKQSSNYDTFENQNILHIYIILELLKNIYEFSKDIAFVNEIIPKFINFDFIYTLYILIKRTSNILIKVTLDILVNLLKNLTYEFEFSLKQIILKKTLIFPLLLKIYIINHNESVGVLSIKFLKSFLISHVEATNLLKNLFPATLFYYIDKNKPNPINWLDHEWDTFFKNLVKDYSSTQLIWNENCRKELLDYIDNLVNNYEIFTNKSNLIECINFDDTVDTSIFPFKESFNSIYYYVNYKEMKMEYSCLKRYFFVWKYYLKKILNEKGRPSLHSVIEKPKKFWKKVMNELIFESEEWKIILLIKCLTILYKMHFETIGVIKNLEYFISLFRSSTHNQKIYLTQFFFVLCDVSDKDIKFTNLKTFINLGGAQILINFIPDLINYEYLEESLENFSLNEITKNIEFKENKVNISINESFLDVKEKMIKVLKQDNMYFHKDFSNYTNYAHVHNSWETASVDIKTCTLIIRLIKILLKRFSLVTETDNKIMYPIPKIKYILLDENNFNKLFIVLFCKDENIVIEFIDLIISYMSDPFSFQTVISKTNLTDLLIYYMLKYRSKAILNYFEQLYHFHNIFFNFDNLLKNLNEDEYNFVNLYEAANKFLLKYFPVNLIYFYYTTDFPEFIKRIFTDKIYNCDLIWNHFMLNYLVNTLHNKYSNFIRNDIKEYYLKNINNEKKAINELIGFPSFKYDDNFRIEYTEIKERVKCFIYYLDVYIDKHKTDSDIMILKNNNMFSINEIIENHITIVLDIIINKILKLKENLESQSEFYNYELKVLFKSLLKIINKHDVDYKSFIHKIIDIYNYLIEKENSTENEQKILKIILKIVFVSIATMDIKSIENLKQASSDLFILMKGLIFFFKKFFSQHHSEYLNNTILNLIKIITSMIKVINRIPEVIELQEDNDNTMETIGDYIHKFLYNEVLQKLMDKKSLDNMQSLSNQLLLCIFELLYSFSKIPKSSMFLIKNGIILEMILFTLFYDKGKKESSELKNSLSKKATIIMNSLICFSNIVKQDTKGFYKMNSTTTCTEFFEGIHNIYGNYLMSFLTNKMNFYQNKSSLSTTFDYDNQIIQFLSSVKTNFEIPDFLWDKRLRNEIKHILSDLINRIVIGENTDYITEFKELKFKSNENEFKIDNVYIRLYNKDPQWKISDPDSFIEKIKQIFLKINEQKIDSNNELEDQNVEIIYTIVNCIQFSKANEKIMFSDKNFVEKCIGILKVSKSQKLTSAILSLLHIFSMKNLSMKIILNSSIYFIFINILTKYVVRDTIEPILRILKNILKNDEYIEKLNLIIFLFLMKCVINLKEGSNQKDINTTRLEILKIIKKFLLNNKIGSVINRLLEFYLPQKIIDNLFGSKDINISLNWLDNELELPDLIWNHEAMNQSKKLIFDDCNFFLQHESKIDGFPQNLIDHKLDQLDPHKCFFFEIVDEFKIENIYLRIFNKDPSYNINKSLVLFLKQVVNQTLKNLSFYMIANHIHNKGESSLRFNKSPSSSSLNEAIPFNLHILKSQFVVCLTEQINFNDFNENLIVSSSQDMKNLIQEDQEKNLIDLVKRSFDYQKLLNVTLIKRILSLHSLFLSNFDQIFDNSIRLLYLEILYIITSNKNGLSLISNLDYIKILEKLYNEENTTGDYEFVISLVTYYRLITQDIMNIGGFLTNCLDKYIDLSNRRPNLLKYIQLIVARILNDSQYGDSIIYKIKNDMNKYRNLSVSLASKVSYFESQYLNVWRKPPENKDVVGIIYKTYHINNFVEEESISSIGIIHNFESRFPIFPKSSITYFNVKDVNYNFEKNYDLSNCHELNNQLKHINSFIEPDN